MANQVSANHLAPHILLSDAQRRRLATLAKRVGRKALFDRTCSVCHGTDGKGDLARPIARSTLFKTKKDVVKFIDGLMPFHNPRKCKDECSANAAQYIIDNFELKLSDNN